MSEVEKGKEVLEQIKKAGSVVRVFACGCMHGGEFQLCPDAEDLQRHHTWVEGEVKDKRLPHEVVDEMETAWREHYSVEWQEQVDVPYELATNVLMQGRSMPRSKEDIDALRKLHHRFEGKGQAHRSGAKAEKRRPARPQSTRRRWFRRYQRRHRASRR